MRSQVAAALAAELVASVECLQPSSTEVAVHAAYDPMADPLALSTIITHAGTLGEEDDDTADVVAYLNLDSRYFDDEDGQRLREVLRMTVPSRDPHDIYDDMFELLDIGHDPDFREPHRHAVEYRRRAHRSLSVHGAPRAPASRRWRAT